MITAIDMTTWDAEVDAIAARFERPQPRHAEGDPPMTADQPIHTISRELGDPTADVWHKAAALILEAVDGREATR